ncbi:SWIM zinc finger family protein [Vibrio sp. JC009]|uniref:SWIM zinc finger family protein n=1 Tax=Vibrio sp. JC009 TaxID=2912314 RepID=UPI0023B167AD|nr:SWIM zinc finger family protein [Vibrio sp. JC009]WED24002.1 SWIM zinc finger family protein [Vibrio sp. JC009]
MSTTSRTWWGKKFIDALEGFTDSGRLSRGRAYRTDKRIKQWQVRNSKVTARILGNANPYFGVYEAPIYNTSVALAPISAKEWEKVIASIGNNAASVCKLMTNEMPDDIEEIFRAVKLHLLPVSYNDFSVSCSCPDYAVPCKHIAGVCYRLSEQLDSDPFLLFELRGLPRKDLQKQLGRSPLGKVLLQSLLAAQATPPPQSSYFTRPQPLEITEPADTNSFWHGQEPLREDPHSSNDALIPALIIKKGGDYPSFWQRDDSYIEAMEEFYLRLRNNSRKFL